MKADVIHLLDGVGRYARDCNAEIAQSGKTVTILGHASRVGTYVWGCAKLAGPEARAEADAINEAQRVLDRRRRDLNARLVATQPTLIAAAKVSPMTPKVKPVYVPLDPDSV